MHFSFNVKVNAFPSLCSAYNGVSIFEDCQHRFLSLCLSGERRRNSVSGQDILHVAPFSTSFTI